MTKILNFMKHEFLLVLPPTIFFFVTFNIITITHSLMVEQYNISLWNFAGPTIGALLVGKVVLIADKLKFINKFPDKPLIYNALWKTFIYIIAVFVVRYGEHLISATMETGNLLAAHHHLMQEVIWPRFWAIQIWLLVLFFVYSSLHEFVRLFGRAEAIRIFLRGRSP